MFRRIGRILAFFVTGFFIWSFFLVIAYGVLPPAVTPLMLLRLLDGAGIHKSWRPLSEISPNLILAAMASEDSKFCAHDGFDWTAIRQDWQRNLRGGQLLGASTISMQTAKNLFLWPDRSWPRKGLEVYFTLLIELAWPKRRIMEIYLNTAEWGPNGEFGIEAGARWAFGKSARDLDAWQAAELTAILPNPHLRSARDPSTLVRRLAALHERRAAAHPALAFCISTPK